MYVVYTGEILVPFHTGISRSIKQTNEETGVRVR